MGVSLLLLLPSLLGIAFVAYLVWRFLLALPTPDPQAERAFLRGKTVWITGASSGIGKALAEHLLAHPSTNVVLSARNEASLSAVAKSLTSGGVRNVMVLPLDLEAIASSASLAAAAVAAVEERFQSVDVLIHNGGMSMRGDVAATTLDVDTRLMRVNFLGAVSLTKAVLPGMLQRRSGSILAMSSVQGKLPIAFRSSYAASKHALHAWCLSLRYELADTPIGVTVISPGYVNTNLSRNALRGDGGAYGKMVSDSRHWHIVPSIRDATTSQGYDPAYVATLSYAALQQNLADVVIADTTARVALMLYALAPQVLERILIKRARKERKAMEQQTHAE